VTIRGDEIENNILKGLKTQLMDPALFEEFTREFVAELNRQRANDAAETDAKRKKIGRISSQITHLVDAIVNGADARALNSRLKELEEEQARLKAESDRGVHDQPLLHPNVATIYRQKVERLGELFRDREHGREALEVLRSLIQEVRLTPSTVPSRSS
jgi:site-specific DNA recombinase